MVRRFLFSSLLIAVFFSLAGCPGKRPDPDKVLNDFLINLRAGRVEVAWAALSQSSQKELTARHERLVAAGAKSPATPAAMLFDDLGLVVVNEPESIAESSPHGQDVQLRVAVKGGQSADVWMVREGDAWKVDLIRSFDKAPPLDEKLEGPEKTETSTD